MKNMEQLSGWSNEEAQDFSCHIAAIDARITEALMREGITYP